jgi:spermidine synthase
MLVVLALAFVLTGAAALVIEQSLERLLSTVVGASADAGAIVLAIYFLGLALGALGYVLVRGRIRSGAVVYGVLEAFIGVYALALGAFFPQLQAWSSQLIHHGGESATLVFVLRLLVAAMWILPPTMAMGGSFPAIVDAVSGSRARSQSLIRVFYALNVVGALLGSLGSAYLAFPAIGVRNTLIAVAVGEMLVAIGVVAMFSRHVSRHSSLHSSASDSQVDAQPGVLRDVRAVFADPTRRSWLLLGFVSGFAVFSFEVLWLHLSGVVFGMSAYTFASLISTVLLGLVIGGVAAGMLRMRPGMSTVGIAIVVGCALLALTYPFWDTAPLWLLRHGDTTTFAGGELVRLRYMLLLVAVPAVGLGLVYPVLLRMSPAPHRPDVAIAALGMANGVGSLSGALITGFLLIGGIGSEEAYRLLMLALVAIPAGIALRRLRQEVPVVAAALVIAVATTLSPLWNRLTLTLGSNVYFRQGFVTPSSELLFWHEDNTGGITTVVTSRGTRTLLTNGKFQGNDAGEMVDQAAFATLPSLMTKGRERALVIGLGTGHSTAVIHSFGFGEVDVVEIARGMPEAAAAFSHINGDVLSQPNVRLWPEDGRNMLLRTDRRYDVISMEISSVWFAGSASLYAEEFYRLARAHLKPGGVMQQWIQLHHIGPLEVLSAAASMRAAFPHVSLWVVGNQGLLIGGEQAPQVDLSLLSQATQAHLIALLGERAARLPVSRFLELADIDRAIATLKPVASNDANRYLEYATPRYNLERGRTTKGMLLELSAFIPEAEREQRLAAVTAGGG